MTSVEREVFAREETRELKERVVEINRVAKVVKGGRRFSFTALVVIGDEHDRVGVGYGKAREVPLAISKAVDDAKKNLFTVPKHGTTITHEVARRVRRCARAAAPRERGNRRHRRRRRPRRPRARRHPRHPREEPRHDEPDQHGEGDRERLKSLRRPEDVARIRGMTISACCRTRPARSEEPAAETGRGRRPGSQERCDRAAEEAPGWRR